MGYISIEHAKELVCRIGRNMWEKQMVAANDGNITVRTGDDEVIMTPTGVSKGELTKEMLIRTNLQGEILEGTYQPTSEIEMHLNAYRHRKGTMSTCHAHCLFLSAFASAGIDLDLAVAPEPTAITGRIPVVPYEIPGTKELAESILPYLKEHKVVMLGNHGPISWGNTPIDAWYTLESAEAFAKSSLILKYIIGEMRPLSETQVDELEARFHLPGGSSRVAAVKNISNKSAGSGLSMRESGISVNLSEKSLEALAEKVAAKLRQ